MVDLTPKPIDKDTNLVVREDYGIHLCGLIGLEIVKLLNAGTWSDTLKKRADSIGINRENFLPGPIDDNLVLPIPSVVLDGYLLDQGFEVPNHEKCRRDYRNYLSVPIPEELKKFTDDEQTIDSSTVHSKRCPLQLAGALTGLLSDIQKIVTDSALKQTQLSLFANAPDDRVPFAVYRPIFERYLNLISSGYLQSPDISKDMGNTNSLQGTGVENTNDYTRLKHPDVEMAEAKIAAGRNLTVKPILTDSGRGAFNIAFDSIVSILHQTYKREISIFTQEDLYFEVNNDIDSKCKRFPSVMIQNKFKTVEECTASINSDKPSVIVIADVANDITLTKLDIDNLLKKLLEKPVGEPIHIIIDTSLTSPKSDYYSLFSKSNRAILCDHNIHITTIESLSKLAQGGLNETEGGGLIITGSLGTEMVSERARATLVPKPKGCLLHGFLGNNFRLVADRAELICKQTSKLAQMLKEFLILQEHPNFNDVHHPVLENHAVSNVPIITLEIRPEITDASPSIRTARLDNIRQQLTANDKMIEGASFGYDTPRFTILSAPSGNLDFPLRYYLRFSPGCGDIDALLKHITSISI